MPKKLLTSGEVIAEYPIFRTERALRNLANARKITFHRIGSGHYYFAPEDIEAFIRSTRIEKRENKAIAAVTILKKS